MSSELQKYIETSIEKKENLLKAEVISFPNEKKFVDLKDLKLPSQKYWKLNDKLFDYADNFIKKLDDDFLQIQKSHQNQEQQLINNEISSFR